MKLSGKTIQVLKNFSTINPSIMFEKGNVLNTISPQMTIMAKAKIDENIEKDFGIFDLNRFLGVLSLFNDPELKLYENYVKISDNNRSVNFIFADPVTMVVPPKKELKVSDPYASFDLSIDALQSVMKGANILQLPDISIEANGERLFCKAIDKKNPTNNSFEIDIQPETKKFKVIISCSNLKLLNKDYRVSVMKGTSHAISISHFVSVDNEIEYFIAVSADST